MYLLSPQFGVSWIFFSSLNFKKLELLAGKRRKDRIVTLFYYFFLKNSIVTTKNGLLRMSLIKAPTILVQLQNF